MTYLIDFDELKENGLIHDHVDSKILRYTLKVVQQKIIRNALTRPLYAKLLEVVEAGGSDDPYTDLLEEYVRPSIVAWVNYRFVHPISNKIRNKGVGKDNDEYQQANTKEDNNAFKAELLNDAEFYTDELVKHLEENADEYPEYQRKCREERRVSYLGFARWQKV